MALTDENSGSIPATMLVGPTGYAGGNNGFLGNGDLSWLILLLLCGWGGGFGMGGFGGGAMWPMMMGGMGGFGGWEFPWLWAGQNNINDNVNSGFRDQQLQSSIAGLQSSVTSGFGDIATQLCGGFAGVNQNVSNGFAGVNLNLCQTGNGIVTAVNGAQNALAQQINANELANLNRSFAEQTANVQGFNGVNAGVADLRYTVATEACADRAAVGDALQAVTMQGYQNTNALLTAMRDGIQSIKDELCNDRLDAERRDNANLRAELMYARGQASQVAQTADIRAAQAVTANQLVNELRSCPIPSQPVYGNQPIFTCNQNPTTGCGCNGNLGFAG